MEENVKEKTGTGRRLGKSPKQSRAKVISAWRRNKKNVSEAARELGCSQNTVRYHLQAAGLISATPAKPAGPTELGDGYTEWVAAGIAKGWFARVAKEAQGR